MGVVTHVSHLWQECRLEKRGQQGGLWAGSGWSNGEEGMVFWVPAVLVPYTGAQPPMLSPLHKILMLNWEQV